MRKNRMAARGRQAASACLPWAVAVVAAATAASAKPSVPPAVPDCQPTYTGGPLFITPDCVDPSYTNPYVDIDQKGSVTDPTTGLTVQYRYIHGGFTGTTTTFSMYFPPARQFRGRFFESTYPTVTTDTIAPSDIVFALYNGAYVIASNNNGGVPAGGVLAGYRANAATANFSRLEAATIYHKSARPRGYLYGASGGAYQTLGAAENSSGVWDGTIPMVPGVPNAIPSFQSNQLLGLDLLNGVLPQIADAMAPGGSGDPYTGLTPAQSATLQEVTKMGFPLRGWWQYATLNGGAYPIVAGVVEGIDTTYVSDFWSVPGYEGSFPSVEATRVQANTSVVAPSGTNSLTLANVPSGFLTNADLTITSGSLSGTKFYILAVSGNTVEISGSNAGITAGTTVNIDNSAVVALQYYQRHQVPTPDEYGWNQYRDADGNPLYPQRPFLVGPILTAMTTGGAIPDGLFYGKMIMLASAMDVQAYSWSADWYNSQAQAALGSNYAGNYRIWFMDNADHDPGGPADTNAVAAADHIVSYTGELQQALLDMDAWVSKGVAPPASTNYTMDYNATQAVLPPDAKSRAGVQPVVTLTVGGGSKIEVAAGKSVTFSVRAQEPPRNGGGRINLVEWDFEGTGSFTPGTPISIPTSDLHQTASFVFSQPGTYFPVVRITSQSSKYQPKGAPSLPYGQVLNLAGVRVIVR